ncbi:hypothetical protein [Chitinimonas sp.]|uniref:hypothetical protein n=1 Tax=Chitinimonas sp. TaxID=1934313 RepID=UPI0035AE423D
MALLLLAVVALRQPLAQPGRKPVVAPVVLAPQKAASQTSSALLLAQLPAQVESLPAILHREADRADVGLGEVSYANEPERALAIRRQQASFTLVENYGASRRFLGKLLSHPSLALEALDCTRDDIVSPELSCAIRVASYGKASTSKVPAHER